jgi:N-acyl-L-homoserine lactone synthetase
MSSSVRVFNSLLHLTNKNTSPIKITYNYADKYLLRKTIINNYINIHSWKSKCLYTMYFDDYSNDNKIFTLDLKINKDIIKIKHLSINNDYYEKTLGIQNYLNKLNDEETQQIKTFIFDYIMSYSKENNIKKIVINIHSNLERYYHELKDEGFVPNYEIKCYSNPYWIKAEKII